MRAASPSPTPRALPSPRALLVAAALASLAAAAACADDAAPPGTGAALGASEPDPSATEPPPPAPEADVDASADAAPPDEGDCPRVKVATGSLDLNVREAPTTASAIVAKLPSGTIAAVRERATGEPVSGTDAWFKVASTPKEGWVSAAFATCTKEPVRELRAMPYRLPLACGTSARISQGTNGGFSHTGRNAWAYDFAIPVGTPLVAMADGIVTATFDATGPGDRCYDGGGADCFRFANYVVLRHGDGTGSIYKHLSKVSVKVGDFLPSGKAVGLSGSTGYSTGPHAHVMRQDACADPIGCQSLRTPFADVPGDGIPDTGQTVKSDNGCADGGAR